MVFGQGVFMDYFDGFSWDGRMGVNLGCKIEFSWEFLNGPPLSDLEGFLVINVTVRRSGD